MSEERTTVLVLGAGFTKAFYPEAPLLIDDYDLSAVVDKLPPLSGVKDIIKKAQEARDDGKLDLEALITRLDTGAPYDETPFQEISRYAVGLVQGVLLDRLDRARLPEGPPEGLRKLARWVVQNRVTCITFNYDDFFDEALYEVTPRAQQTDLDEPLWFPDNGYGFYCRPVRAFQDAQYPTFNSGSWMRLLKLHGSINWRTPFGSAPPHLEGSVLHDEGWFRKAFPAGYTPVMEPGALLVPPVLTKVTLAEEPVLRLVWMKAYGALMTASQVAFVGCSLPPTDYFARWLFTETLVRRQASGRSPRARITVVNKAEQEEDKNRIRQHYRELVGALADDQFDFRGALDWSCNLVNSS